jgi:two-component system, chemotaxis family, protein-glutamate methylesterase/glutaminase
VQHLSPHHPSQLANLLARESTLPVHESTDGTIAVGGNVYIAPPDRHLLIENGRLVLSEGERVRFSRPSVDRLFESVAESYDGAVIAVILTGAGMDGTNGARAIRAAGGRVVVQSEESSTNYGMPGSAEAAGMADRVLDIEQIAQYLDEETREP